MFKSTVTYKKPKEAKRKDVILASESLQDRLEKLKEETRELSDAIEKAQADEADGKAVLEVLAESADVTLCAELLARKLGEKKYFNVAKRFKVDREYLRRRLGDRTWCATNPKKGEKL